MRSLKFLLVTSLLGFLFSSNGNAQQKLVNVAPGYGSLNDSVAAEGPATYVLQAGGWYGLNAPLQTPTTGPVTIIGTTPAAGQMPAMIQTGYTSSGTTFTYMFKTYNDLTLKHVFLVNADLNGGWGSGVFYVAGPGRIVVDSIVADPVANHYFLESYVKNHLQVDIFVTNSLFIKSGLTTSNSDGYFFANLTWDTLYFENNTVVNPNQQFIKGPNAENDTVGFYWINHNTFFFLKNNFKSDFGDSNTYITNNLLWMGGFVPEAFRESSPDGYVGNSMHGLILDDTLLYENSLPSGRKHFVEYNFNYRAQGCFDLVNWLNSQNTSPWNGTKYYLPNFIPSIAWFDSSRETRMYNTKSAFPYFFCNNNVCDTNAEIKANDPQWVDQKIYTLTHSAVVWADSVVYQLYGGATTNSALWPNFFYYTDTSASYPTTWPRFNGAYTNPTLMTASIEKLPLGDLNWFPNQKAIWKANQQAIMQHILAENESQMNLTAVKNLNGGVPATFALAQNYPNPFNPSTEISYSIPKNGMVSLKVFNVLGQEVATLVNEEQNAGNHVVSFDASKLASGIYFYTLRQEGNSITRKMLLLK